MDTLNDSLVHARLIIKYHSFYSDLESRWYRQKMGKRGRRGIVLASDGIKNKFSSIALKWELVR